MYQVFLRLPVVYRRQPTRKCFFQRALNFTSIWLPLRYRGAPRGFQSKPNNWVIKRKMFVYLFSAPLSATGDSCCVLARIYFTAHRCIITYLMYQKQQQSFFIHFADIRSDVLIFFSLPFALWERKKVEEKAIRYTHRHHTLHNQIFIFCLCSRSPAHLQGGTGGKSCAELNANVIWNWEVECNQLWWFLSFSRCCAPWCCCFPSHSLFYPFDQYEF